MAVLLRWLLVDLAIKRILRHPAIRARFHGAGAPMMSRYTAPQFAGGLPQGTRSETGVFGRKRRLSCGSGCLALVAALVLGSVLLVALVQWLF